MKKTWLKISGGVLFTLGLLFGLAMLITIYNLMGYSQSSGYVKYVVIGVVFSAVNIFLGKNLLKLEEGALSSSLIFSVIMAILLGWFFMKGQYSQNDEVRAVAYFISNAVGYTIFLIYMAIFILTLSSVFSKSD